MRLPGSLLIGLIVCCAGSLTSCIAGTGSDAEAVGGQKLTCVETEPGCRCSIAPAINLEVIDECRASSIDSPQGTSAHCCEESLIVNGKDEGVYLCDCRATRCAASEHTCGCEPETGVKLAQGETVVADCRAFADQHPALKCCANGDRCRCTESACGSSEMQVPFCDGESLCEGIGKRSAESCK
jgi:hypothetical protein